jgi:hypothetical protein
MESLAYPFLVIVQAMYALGAASLVISILVAIGKAPKVVGYVAVGIQAILTIFAYLMRVEFGYVYTAVLALCAVLVFTRGARVKK